MPVTEIEVTVTSHEGRDDLYAELFAGSIQCAEVRISHDGDQPVVTIFPPLDGKPYEFTVAALQNALSDAVARLYKVERG